MRANQTAGHAHSPNSGQSLTGEVLCIDVSDIDLFDKNPRTSRNPAYGRIKASILANGLDQPLIVTKRPGDERFMVHAGGNTRLQILKELYAVSDDPAFAMVNCIFVGWNSESTVLLAHLRENDLRGDLTFIDKAVAICALEDLLSEEAGTEKPSIRELQRILKKRGFSVSAALISYMRYAVNFLLPVMPVALSDGLGRRQIQKIRGIQRLAKEIWVNRGLGSESDFDSIFSELCRRYDSPDWQIDSLKRAVETEIAEADDISVQLIRTEMECRGTGQTLKTLIPEPQENAEYDTQNEVPDRDTILNVPDSQPEAGRVAQLSVEIPLGRPMSDATAISEHAMQTVSCVDTLRCRAYQLAESLARRYGIAELVTPLPDSGLGFLIKDVPSTDLIERVDDELRASVCTVWWQLLTFSETLSAPNDIVDMHCDQQGELQSILRDGKVRLLFERIWIIDPGNFAAQFWSRLSNQDWCDWLQLANTYRDLHKQSIEQERPLWEPLS